MTAINETPLEAAAIAFNEAELRKGSVSLGDQLAAAIAAYREADVGQFASSTAVLGIGDEQMQGIQDAIEQRFPAIREQTRKFFDGILDEALNGFSDHFANDTRWNLDRLIVEKAKLLVNALLQGDERVLKDSLGWRWCEKNRRAVLDAVSDYAAKAEVERLREQVKNLEESLRFRGSY